MRRAASLLPFLLLSLTNLSASAPQSLAPLEGGIGAALDPETVAAAQALARTTTCENDNCLKVSLLSDPVKLGNTSPADIFKTLKDHCGQNSCENDPWIIGTSLVDNLKLETDGQIEVQVVDVTFRDNSLDDLIEALTTIAEEASEHHTEAYTTNNNCNYCRDNCGTCQQGEDREMEQWSTSGLFDLRVDKKDGSLKDHIRISIKFVSGDGSWLQEFCNVATGVGSAAYGAIGNDLASTGFSLASLACDAF